MWTRQELKNRGRNHFFKNYWTVIAVCFILAIFAGENGQSVTAIQESDSSSNWNVVMDLSDTLNNAFQWLSSLGSQAGSFLNQLAENLFNGFSSGQHWFFKVFEGGVFIASGLAALALKLFIGNVFSVGSRRFCMENRERKVEIRRTLFGFRPGNYLNIVEVMFFKWLYILLWSLLLIIPGIIKSYKYRMVPYILAENPSLDRKRVLELSKAMMDGQKWNTFLLDLSFFLWQILSAFTLGLAGIFYVNGYVLCTEGELYAILRQNSLERQTVYYAELPGFYSH